MSYQMAGHQSGRDSTVSSFGLPANVAALIGYLFVPVTGIAVLMTEKDNPLVRFHAWQSLFFGLGIFALSVVLSLVFMVVSFVLSSISPVAGVLITVLMLLLSMFLAVVILTIWLFCLIKAYKGEMYRLPILGKLAEQRIGR